MCKNELPKKLSKEAMEDIINQLPKSVVGFVVKFADGTASTPAILKPVMFRDNNGNRVGLYL